MAARITAMTTQTPTGTADAAALANGTYPCVIRGASATQRTKVMEVYLGGQASASAVNAMVLARDSTVGTGTNSMGTGQTDAPVDPATAALAAPVVVGNSNTTAGPQRSATDKLQNLSYNAFGGVVRWQPPVGYEPTIVGSTASAGEMSLSCLTGFTPGAQGSHLVYETL